MSEKEFVVTYRLTDLFNNELEAHEFYRLFIELLNMFKDNFILKKIDYFYKKDVKSPQQKLSLHIKRSNVMHLFGISYYSIEERKNNNEYNQPSYGEEFFRDFESGKLNLSKCWVESLSKVNDKMSVLQYLPEIKTDKVRIGEHGVLRKIEMTNSVRTSKTFLGLGLIHDNPEFSTPLTCLNLKEDSIALKNKSFSGAGKCTKIIIYDRLPNGTWKKIDSQNFSKIRQEESSAKKRKLKKSKKNKKPC